MTSGPALESSVVSSNISHNSISITSAGTAQQFTATEPATKVIITAFTNNTGIVVVGNENVVAANDNTLVGIPLVNGESVQINIDNISLLYLDAVVSGEGVTYTYLS